MADVARYDDSFDIDKEQIIVRHLFKEVWDRKLVLTVPHFPSYNINSTQSLLSPLGSHVS